MEYLPKKYKVIFQDSLSNLFFNFYSFNTRQCFYSSSMLSFIFRVWVLSFNNSIIFDQL
jgi:hypothetical protein